MTAHCAAENILAQLNNWLWCSCCINILLHTTLNYALILTQLSHHTCSIQVVSKTSSTILQQRENTYLGSVLHLCCISTRPITIASVDVILTVRPLPQHWLQNNDQSSSDIWQMCSSRWRLLREPKTTTASRLIAQQTDIQVFQCHVVVVV